MAALVVALLMSFFLFFYRAATAPQQSSGQAVVTVNDPYAESIKQKNVVSAPIARPFAAVTDAEAEDDSEGDEASADEQASVQQSEGYQDAVVVSQTVATAYGTFNAGSQSAEEWVGTIPNLSDDLRGQLTVAAEDQWPEMADRESSATATAVAQSVKPVRVSKDGRSLVLSVSVTQETSRDGAKGLSSTGFVISMRQGEDGQWSVVGLS